MTKWILIFGLVVYWSFHFWNNCTNTIDWRQQTFEVRGTYCSWEGYKSLMDTLEPSEAARASREMMAVSIPDYFDSRSSYSDFFYDLSFPGYSRSTYGAITDDLGDVYTMYGVELPNEGADRNALFKLTSGSIEIDGPMVKILEFVDNSGRRLEDKITIDDGELLYMASDGKVIKKYKIDSPES